MDAPSPIHFLVYDEPQLFTDNALIECCRAVTRRWYKPERHPTPVLTSDRPWEEGLYFTYSNYTVRHDPEDGLIKCWYEDLGPRDGKTHGFHNSLLYARSEDGITFTKPELDVCTVDGQATNIVMGYAKGGPATPVNPWAEEGVHSNTILIDPHAATADERFRTVFSHCKQRGDKWMHITSGAHSPDGIHWTPYDERPSYGTARDNLSDVSCLWYDEDSREFVQNTRHGRMTNAAPRPPETPRQTGGWFGIYYPHRPDLMNKRRIFQSRSHDFIHWSEPLEICRPDDEVDNLDEAYYGMPQFRVGRQFFGLLGVFQFTDNRMVVRLMQSRDGLNWRPADNATPFLEPRGPRHWDAHMVSMTSPPVERGSEWWFYHGGTNSHHDWWMSGKEELDTWEARHPERIQFQMGLATLRKEGFASLSAGPLRDGMVQTRALVAEGNRLLVNARCEPGGSVRVALVDASGTPMGSCDVESCDAFTGDDVAHCVSWQGVADLPVLDGKTRPKLLFVLRNAHLYSFRFAKA